MVEIKGTWWNLKELGATWSLEYGGVRETSGSLEEPVENWRSLTNVEEPGRV